MSAAKKVIAWGAGVFLEVVGTLAGVLFAFIMVAVIISAAVRKPRPPKTPAVTVEYEPGFKVIKVDGRAVYLIPSWVDDKIVACAMEDLESTRTP